MIHVICTLKALDAWVVREYSSTPIVRRLSACSKLISLIRSIDYHNFLELKVVVVSRMSTCSSHIRGVSNWTHFRAPSRNAHVIALYLKGFPRWQTWLNYFWFIEKAGSAISDVSAQRQVLVPQVKAFPLKSILYINDKFPADVHSIHDGRALLQSDSEEPQKSR